MNRFKKKNLTISVITLMSVVFIALYLYFLGGHSTMCEFGKSELNYNGQMY